MIIDRKTIVRFLGYLIFIPFIPIWWLQVLIPRNPKVWVFGAWSGRTYNDNSKALFEHALIYEPDVCAIWLTRDNTIYKYLKAKNYQCYMVNSIMGVFISLTAGYVFISNGKSDVNRYFINGSKIIHLWHGAPMKKIGLDELKSKKGKNRSGGNRELDNKFFWLKLPELFFPFFYEYGVDRVVSTAKVFNPLLASAFNLSEENVILSGYPRNDVFFKKKAIFCPTIKNISHFKKIILYLPTFRTGKGLEFLFEGYKFNGKRLDKFLIQNNALLIIKAHFASNVISFRSTDNIRYLRFDPFLEINNILKQSDILITDYSGCYFDYLLTGKPIIFAPFDYDDYCATDRDLYFKYDDAIAGTKVRDWVELEFELGKIFAGDDRHCHLRTLKNKDFNEFNDSFSSKRITEYIKIIKQ